ncbi:MULTISPECIES: hypothetical protein [Paenibacillus]|uniref:S-adenosylmethionine decarboxylase n=1 Tax=Paenibacillus whitsoniae TaxID=2496558 RepID=A0A3S0BJJ3_9BACL|nr:hypothetical protein [Paenibacillus whitsoniae]RTE08017.1 hypothetical protein EJQ19_19425 [Paenibacillus whitsoniae]
MWKQKLMRKAILYGVVLLLILWPLYSLKQMLTHRGESHDANHLLFQVSVFQMEVLKNYLDEAPQSKSTRDLDAVKQALYSASYTHDRLVLAAGGSEELTGLSFVDQLSQFVQRMQLGGARTLKPDEIQTLKETRDQYDKMYDIYEKLMASNGDIVSSQNAKLAELDGALAAFLRKKGLQ